MRKLGTRKALVLVLCVVGALPAANAQAGPGERKLAARVTLRVPLSDGTTRLETRTVEQWMGRWIRSTGPAGTPEIVGGDIYHSYVNTRSGSALAYSVTQSSRMPSTPGAVVPGDRPGFTPLFVAGGSWYNVRSSIYDYGIHTAGTTKDGSNVDTAAGPGPSPIVLPLVHSTDRQDFRIDFAGQLVFLTQGQTCDAAGVCTAVGFFLGSGAAVFDTDKVSMPSL